MRHVVEDLTAFVDGALPPDRRANVAHHLEGCAACRSEHRRIGDAVAVLARLPPPPEPSATFAARLEARLADLRRPTLAERLAAWRWRLGVPSAVAAAVVAVVLATHGRGPREADVADHLELLEDYVVVAGLGEVETAEDAAIVAHLDELAPAAREGKP
jgi:anti-sigma factor RsiW